MMAQRTRKPSCSQPPDEAHGRLAQAFIGSLASNRSICVFGNGPNVQPHKPAHCVVESPW